VEKLILKIFGLSISLKCRSSFNKMVMSQDCVKIFVELIMVVACGQGMIFSIRV
jgi:translation elongation factor EF-Tu-like GTPase